MTIKAHQKDVPSASDKWPLMARQAKAHEMAVLIGGTSIEVVSHDTGVVEADSRLGFDMARAEIMLRVRDRRAVDRFYTDGLGFRVDGERLRFEGRFPQWSVTIRVTQDAAAPLDPPLDLEGWSCLAFYATNPEADLAQLRNAGGRDSTAMFPVEWEGGRLGITMLRDPEGTIIELIKILDRK